MRGSPRTALLGITMLVVFLILGVAVWIGLAGNASAAGDGDSEAALGRALEKELGVQPEVTFQCRLPVVGVAPCVLGERTGSQAVRLAFHDHGVPGGAVPDAYARSIARLAFEASAFARGADSVEVIFDERGEYSSVVRTYSFPTETIALDAAVR